MPGYYILHKVIFTEIIQCFIIRCRVKSEEDTKYIRQQSLSTVGFMQTHLLVTLTDPRPGFVAALGFFFPLALSRCSFCFSLASVVSADAAFRVSTSFKG